MIVVLVIVILCLLIFICYQYKKVNIEGFENSNNNYLYPVRGLQAICKEKYGLRPAFGPDVCVQNGKVNPYANCMCVDDSNVCQICYPDNSKFNTGSTVVYDGSGPF